MKRIRAFTRCFYVLLIVDTRNITAPERTGNASAKFSAADEPAAARLLSSAHGGGNACVNRRRLPAPAAPRSIAQVMAVNLSGARTSVGKPRRQSAAKAAAASCVQDHQAGKSAVNHRETRTPCSGGNENGP